MTHVLVLVVYFPGSQEISMSASNFYLFEPKGNKKYLITMKHGRSYPSSVDYLCSMSCCIGALYFYFGERLSQ